MTDKTRKCSRLVKAHVDLTILVATLTDTLEVTADDYPRLTKEIGKTIGNLTSLDALLKSKVRKTASERHIANNQRIHVAGFVPESEDETQDHPQMRWEWNLCGVGGHHGKFRYIGGDTYCANRDITYKEYLEILGSAHAVGLVITIED